MKLRTHATLSFLFFFFFFFFFFALQMECVNNPDKPENKLVVVSSSLQRITMQFKFSVQFYYIVNSVRYRLLPRNDPISFPYNPMATMHDHQSAAAPPLAACEGTKRKLP